MFRTLVLFLAIGTTHAQDDAESQRLAAWKEDLQVLATEFPERHKNAVVTGVCSDRPAPPTREQRPVPLIPREWPTPPLSGPLAGNGVELREVDAEGDAPELFDRAHGTPEREALWTYMGYGPFADADAMGQWLADCQASEDPLFFVVRDHATGRRVGMASLLNLRPSMGVLEIGHLWYVPDVQRTHVNTATVFLLLSHAFDVLGCRRVEWKCDASNERSRKAALRLGFTFEGIFRQHLIVKGRNRDTAWYALLDGEWPAAKSVLALRQGRQDLLQ